MSNKPLSPEELNAPYEAMKHVQDRAAQRMEKVNQIFHPYGPHVTVPPDIHAAKGPGVPVMMEATCYWPPPRMNRFVDVYVNAIDHLYIDGVLFDAYSADFAPIRELITRLGYPIVTIMDDIIDAKYGDDGFLPETLHELHAETQLETLKPYL